MTCTLRNLTLIILMIASTSTTGDASNLTFLTQENPSLRQENPQEPRTIPSDILPQCSESHLNLTHLIMCHNTEPYIKFDNELRSIVDLQTNIRYWMKCWKTSCWKRFETLKSKTKQLICDKTYNDPINKFSLMILIGGLYRSNQVVHLLETVGEVYETFLNHTLKEIKDRKYLRNDSSLINCQLLFPDCRDDLHERYLDFLDTLSKMKTIHMFRKYVNPTILFMTFCAGMLWNGTLISIFVRNSELRTIPNTMIMHISVCDVLFLLFVMPLYYYIFDYGLGAIGLQYQPHTTTCQLILLYVSAFSVLAMSIQRYLAISKSLNTPYCVSNTPRCYVFVSILAVWLCSAGVVAPLYFPSRYHTVVGGKIMWENVLVRLFTILFIIIGVTVFNVLTSIKIKKSAEDIPGETARARTELLRSRYRSSNIIIALTVVFSITHVVFVFRCFSAFLSVPLKYHYYSECAKNYLYFLGASLNPIALFVTSRNFRILFKKYIFRCC